MKPFDHFPKEAICPICGTSEDEKCILVQIDETSDGSISEAQPVHLDCALVTNYNKDAGVMYRIIK